MINADTIAAIQARASELASAAPPLTTAQYLLLRSVFRRNSPPAITSSASRGRRAGALRPVSAPH